MKTLTGTVSKLIPALNALATDPGYTSSVLAGTAAILLEGHGADEKFSVTVSDASEYPTLSVSPVYEIEGDEEAINVTLGSIRGQRPGDTNDTRFPWASSHLPPGGEIE